MGISVEEWRSRIGRFSRGIKYWLYGKGRISKWNFLYVTVKIALLFIILLLLLSDSVTLLEKTFLVALLLTVILAGNVHTQEQQFRNLQQSLYELSDKISEIERNSEPIKKDLDEVISEDDLSESNSEKGEECQSLEEIENSVSVTTRNEELSSTQEAGEISDRGESEECNPMPGTISHSIKREPNALLSDDRSRLLQTNREQLKHRIKLDETMLLDILIEKSVISQEDQEIIRGMPGESDNQLEKLLEIIENKSNKDFDELCNALIQINKAEIVENLLITEGDIQTARDSLVSFLRTHYTDLHLYSTNREACPVPLSKLYVNMQWKMGRKNQELEDFLKEIGEQKDTRFVVSGEAGSGKTTTVKRICQIWIEPEQNKGLLSGFTLVLPIVLRAIGKLTRNLKEIIRNQYPTMSELDVLVIVNYIEHTPEKVLVLLDGYDELKYRDIVHEIIDGKLYTEAKVVSTTRPHGITLLKYLGSKATEKVVHILGFNQDQIIDYIHRFYELRNDKEKGERLITHLLSKPYLLDLATVPIRLEMICLVWDISEDLGEQLVDLYRRFVQHLLDHMERKENQERTSETEILNIHKPLLLSIGNLAYTFHESGRLKAILSYEELQSKLGEFLGKALDFGCLVKYYPVHNLEDAEWQFSHLTIQEFFVAYYLAKNDDNADIISAFTDSSQSVQMLQRNKTTISFLCGLNPHMANKIIQKIVRKIRNESSWEELFYLLRDFVSCFRCREEAQLPLPYGLRDVPLQLKRSSKPHQYEEVTDENEREDLNELNQCLLDGDKENNLQNLNVLTINKFTGSSQIFTQLKGNLHYVKHLSINEFDTEMTTESNTEDFASRLQTVQEIKLLSWKGSELCKVFFEHLPKTNIRQLSLKAQYLQEMDACISGKIPDLDKFFNLQKLEILAGNQTFGADMLHDICEKINKMQSMNVFVLQNSKIPIQIFQVRDSIEINIEIIPHRCSFQPSELSRNPFFETVPRNLQRFVSLIPEALLLHQINRHSLCLNGNDLSTSGHSLGKLLCLQSLKIIKFMSCSIRAETLEEMVDVLDNDLKCNSTSTSVQELVLHGNYLKHSGIFLGKLLQYMKVLNCLEIQDDRNFNESLTDKDLMEMNSSKTDCNPRTICLVQRIVQTGVYGNPVHVKRENVVKISNHIASLNMNLRNRSNDDSIVWIDVADSLSHQSVSHLQVLSLDNYDFSGGRFRELVDHLPVTLEALSTAHCSVSDIQDLLYLINNKPEPLRNLNFIGNLDSRRQVYNDDSGQYYSNRSGFKDPFSCVMELLTVKTKLMAMHKLVLQTHENDHLVALRRELRPGVEDLILYEMAKF